ncbi:Exodeoxyribonuclease [Acaryochloris thomasi RCC1774]|uniref:Exodeoxyribonuclease n=1 Tax=Acaryochloris thomasi RCC1774 TaxID=1764569 RepID=A0A2W1JBK1_9CYAN|nr:exodeoxyribonuclease III [Acaryochloris thomasi]PZD71276.1 Exodeoxyribonuclease [Acaryochloris thomasi RCC1774]
MTKISTWNVNSIRTRITHVTDWLQTNPVDVLCLQETKVVDADFPHTPFEEIGYQAEIFGQKAYNGVALISKSPLTNVQAGFTPVLEAAGKSLDEATFFDEQKRVITGVTASGLRVVNLYVPNGSSVGSEKYDYKLRWFRLLKQYMECLLAVKPKPILICGDFNIALEDRDIYKPEGREKHIMSTPVERESLRSILELGFADVFRKFTAESGHYSWWDYRAASFNRNMGWRIDHHYLTPELYERATSCTIDKAPRGLEKPSDHTPVTVEISD